MEVIFRDDLAINCVFEIHLPDKNFNPVLSAEPYVASSCGAGITVAVIVVVIGYQLIYLGRMGNKQGNHYGMIK